MGLVINGRSLARRMTGVERYAHAITDVVLAEWPGSRVLLPSADVPGLLRALRSAHGFGRTKGHIWEQLELPRAVGSDVLLSPANTGPLRAQRQVLVVHDLAWKEHPAWFSQRFLTWYSTLVPRLCRKASAIITPSEAVRSNVIRSFSLPERAVHVVPPFLNNEWTPPTAPVTDKPYVLMVASLDPRKGIDRAMRWFCALQQPAFDLVVVGSPHRAFAHVGLPSGPGIRCMPHQEEEALRKLYAGAIALLHPSRLEGFGLTVLEALSLGVPVIATDLEVFRENFHEAPLYVDMEDDQAITHALMQVMEPGERVKRSALGIRTAACFNRARTAHALHGVLDPILLN